MEQTSARLAEGSATPPPPGLQPSGRPAADSAAADAHAPMVFSASTFEPRAAWACAVQPDPSRKLPVWVASWRRFQAGESIECIAVSPKGGKAIQPVSVVSHLMTALTHGRPLDLQRLAQQCETNACAPPTRDEWARLVVAEASAGVDVVANAKVGQVELLKPILPEAAKPFIDRTEVEATRYRAWCTKTLWYLALRRIELQPSFESSGKPAADSAAADAHAPMVFAGGTH